MRYGVVGNRTGFTRDFVFDTLSGILMPGDIIISGGASGVDTYAVDYALSKNLEFEVRLPDTRFPSPQRYFDRNERIVDDCDILIAFNKSVRSGTINTINIAKRYGKKIILIK